MRSPGPLYFVRVAIVALWCACVGFFGSYVAIILDMSFIHTSMYWQYDGVLVIFLGSMTGATVHIGFTAVRLWRLRLAVDELRRLGGQ